MFKRIAYIFLLLPLLSFAQVQLPDEIPQIIGKVKKLVEIRHDTSHPLVNDITFMNTWHFNEEGKVTKHATHFDSTEYFYDSRMRLERKVFSEPRHRDVFEYFYGEDDGLSSIIHTSHLPRNEQTKRITYRGYGKAGTTDTTYYVDMYGDTSDGSKEVRFYDEKSRPVKVLHYIAIIKEPYNIETYKYNSTGAITEFVRYGSEGAIELKYNYTYNKGLVTRQVCQTDPYFTMVFDKSYTDFDGHGNYLKQITRSKGTGEEWKTNVTDRTIEYYP